MESPGARLKKIRLERGLTLEEVHKKTKIHLNILKAIEEDTLINLSPVYVRGFLKIYCKFLGVNPTDFIAGYKEPESFVQCLPGIKEPTSIFKKLFRKVIPFRQYIPIKKVIIFVLLVAFTFVLFNLARFAVTSSWRKALKTRPARVSSDKIARKKMPVVGKLQAPPKEEGSQKSSLLGVKLVMRAKEDCWVELKSDGKIVFKNVLRKGHTETWQAKEKIELFLGNAGAVDLEINNRLIPPVGRKGQGSRIIVTKAGFEIKR